LDQDHLTLLAKLGCSCRQLQQREKFIWKSGGTTVNKIVTWEDGKKVVREAAEAELTTEGLTVDQIRLRRNQLLAASDWTQIDDAPVDQAAWATYRQALRDVPQQAGFPDDVAWPDKP